MLCASSRSATTCCCTWRAKPARASRPRAAPVSTTRTVSTGTTRRSPASASSARSSRRSRTSRLRASIRRLATGPARMSARAARRATGRRSWSEPPLRPVSSMRAESAAARPGLFLYRLDAQRFCEGGALSDGGNLHSWLVHTLRDVADDELASRPPAGHGLVFNAFLGGERSLGWNPDRRGELRGLSFATSALDILQAALENVCYQLADCARLPRWHRFGRRDRRRTPSEPRVDADSRGCPRPEPRALRRE